MIRLTIISISLILAIIILENCGTANEALSDATHQLEPGILVAYGEAIYKREACSKCHTQKVVEESPQLISLDGIGGKYSNSWLYFYLFKPDDMSPQSTMPPYAHLYVRQLDKSILTNIKSKNGLKASPDQLWKELTKQSEQLKDSLLLDGITADQTEILPLIAYIQQIPRTQGKKTLDSIEIAKLEIERAMWDNIGMENNRDLKNLRIIIEAVAVVDE